MISVRKHNETNIPKKLAQTGYKFFRKRLQVQNKQKTFLAKNPKKSTTNRQNLNKALI